MALGLLFSSHIARDVSLGEAKLIGALILPLPARCGWNSFAMAVLWPWRVRAMLVQGTGVSKFYHLSQASSWPMYVRLYVWVCVMAKGKAFGSPRLEDHIGGHGAT